MKILVTGGGTAGHVTPLLAVASELHAQDNRVTIRYVGQRKDPIAQLVTDSGMFEKQYHIFAGKFRRYHGLSFIQKIQNFKMYFQNIRDVLYVAIGCTQSFFILLFWRPQVVFVKGGFVGLPVGLAAALLRVPIVTHDSDTLPGLTNRVLSRFSTKCAVALPINQYTQYYAESKLVQTGIPIRAEYFNLTSQTQITTRQSLGIDTDAKVITIIGGSLGADGLNSAVKSALPRLMSDERISVLWVTGKKQFEELKNEVQNYNAKGERVRLFAFVSELFGLMDAADVVVSRAGATSIAELAAAKKPTIVIPSPYLAGNHQAKNSEVLANQGAALFLEEKTVFADDTLLAHSILKVLDDAALATQLSTNISRLAVPGASAKIAHLLLEVGEPS
jgi:UDP-N-acetylglucosamine--N-acetylmuramyl-(pentapeptide) pyrophosphoryl-undecaprenol N-acetylglucosamine transferase